MDESLSVGLGNHEGPVAQSIDVIEVHLLKRDKDTRCLRKCVMKTAGLCRGCMKSQFSSKDTGIPHGEAEVAAIPVEAVAPPRKTFVTPFVDSDAETNRIECLPPRSIAPQPVKLRGGRL